MEISQIRSSFPFLLPTQDKAESAAKSSGSVNDVNDVRAPRLLGDAEAEDVLNEAIGMIGADPAAALSVHSGLSESRVFALLGL